MARPTTDSLRPTVRPVGGYEHISFTLPVQPVPCPRPRMARSGHTYYPAAYQRWRTEAGKHVPTLPALFKRLVAVRVLSVLPQFKTVTRDAPRGDVDNYAKAVLDLLTSSKRVWADDTQVSLLVTDKRFVVPGEEPHTWVYIREVSAS